MPNSRPQPEPPDAASPLDMAAYIRELTSELAGLARTAELDTLAYLLDMVEHEASTLIAQKRLTSKVR